MTPSVPVTVIPVVYVLVNVPVHGVVIVTLEAGVSITTIGEVVTLPSELVDTTLEVVVEVPVPVHGTVIVDSGVLITTTVEVVTFPSVPVITTSEVVVEV